MNNSDRSAKLKALQESAKTLQAEYGWMALKAEEFEARKAEIRKQLSKENLEFQTLSQTPPDVAAEPVVEIAAADAAAVAV